MPTQSEESAPCLEPAGAEVTASGTRSRANRVPIALVQLIILLTDQSGGTGGTPAPPFPCMGLGCRSGFKTRVYAGMQVKNEDKTKRGGF